MVCEARKWRYEKAKGGNGNDKCYQTSRGYGKVEMRMRVQYACVLCYA